MVLMAMLVSISSNAQDYYAEHAIGWHWYQDPKERIRKPNDRHDPIAAIQSIKHSVTRALDAAILDPTPEHLKHYIILQNQLSARSEIFSKRWQQVLLSHPELNYSLTHPTNGVALKVYHDKRMKQEEAAINTFAENTGLFFFYRSTCPYCQRFSPIVKDFTEHYHINVIPITLDGINLPEFPDSKKDNGQARTFHVTVEPSLYAVNPYTEKAYPVSYGLVTEDELKKRILQVITEQQGGSA